MTDLVQLPLVVHNLHGGGEPSEKVRRKIIKKFLDGARGGMGSFNELKRSDRGYLKRLAKARGLKVFIHHQNGGVWDPSLIKVTRKRVRKIMQGGYVGADGAATARIGDDDRRVGPNRYALYLDCTVIEIDVDFEWDITHLVARSFTAHRWRIPLFIGSLRSLAKGIHRRNGVLMGDMNSPDYIDLPGFKEVVEQTPVTFGKSKHYDQILRWGPAIDIVKIHEEETPSDHDELKCIIKFYQLPRKG